MVVFESGGFPVVEQGKFVFLCSKLCLCVQSAAVTEYLDFLCLFRCLYSLSFSSEFSWTLHSYPFLSPTHRHYPSSLYTRRRAAGTTSSVALFRSVRNSVWTASSPIVPVEQQLRVRWDPWVWSLQHLIHGKPSCTMTLGNNVAPVLCVPRGPL